MERTDLTGRALVGTAGGLAGTLTLQQLMSATASRFPATTPPFRGNPGEFMVKRVERVLPDRVQRAIPKSVESVASQALALGYGLTFGALYGVARRKPGHLLIDGAALGLVTWAAGYLGWLPATGLLPPVTRQKAAQALTPIWQHIAFGIVAVSIVRLLSRQRVNS
jgi:hypothetical protein